MAKVTSKYQVTVPRRIAAQYNIHPGDYIDWVPAGDAIRVIPHAQNTTPQGTEPRLHLFDQATERHRRRPSGPVPKRTDSRGWKREDLDVRGRSR